ncbi:hypothetical protein [Salinisphaera sp. C84B14]|uniref:hypothetical protein n=1 Tax=Salinisphaera sp. C84B14 TaxID=1304155 RepID=UPI003342BB35
MTASTGTVLFELTVPSTWPPDHEILVYRGRFKGARISVVISPDATLKFSSIHNEETHELLTPVIDMPNHASLKVAFGWGGECGPSAAINGTLFNDRLVSQEPIKISSLNHMPTGLRKQLDFELPNGLSLQEERLARSVIELQERISLPDRIHILEASVILRRILLDAHPLAHCVNRQYRCRLAFPAVRDHVDNLPVESVFSYINLSPLFAAEDDVCLLSWDQFLSLIAVRGDDIDFTVREVIDVCANTKGGVHFDSPKSGSSAKLLKLDDSFQPALIDASLHALADLSWCVVQALKPLIEKICAKYDSRPQT